MNAIKIDAKKIWQTTAMDEAVAEELFGWKWLAFTCRPTRSHPEYPKEMRVRRFYPPVESLGKQWAAYFKEHPHEPATGDEPLSYCYCSSNGPHMVPHFSGHEDAILQMEKELHRRKLWDDYQGFLAARVRSDDTAKLRFASCEDKCIAALAAVGSKYVTAEDHESP